MPEFLERLSSSDVKTVLLAGCGGGFDFVHASLIWPELRRLGKEVVWHSYSFGRPERIGDAPLVWSSEGVEVRRVSSDCIPPVDYCPEVHLASYLDSQRVDDESHWLYASYARDWTVPSLTEFYTHLVREHDLDAVVLFDGGSDSLMMGDEEGLGDPIEDAVSVAAVSNLEVEIKLLVAVGLGADRFNHVSDGATLRAVAELRSLGGFLGSLSIDSRMARQYRELLEHIYARQEFRSVLSGCIAAAARGLHGSEVVPEDMAHRVREGGVYIWPLMAMLWGFDVDSVASRSLIVDWIRDVGTVRGCYEALEAGRADLELRQVEELPSHSKYRNPWGKFY